MGPTMEVSMQDVEVDSAYVSQAQAPGEEAGQAEGVGGRVAAKGHDM